MVAAAVGVVLVGCGGAQAGAERATHLDLARIHMGVACPQPNSIRCDRVGLAVWLRKPTQHLEAKISGRPVKMRLQPERRRLNFYEGYLAPAGLIDGPLRVRPERGRYRWTGRQPVSARVRLVAHYSNGKSAQTTLHVGLAPGWG